MNSFTECQFLWEDFRKYFWQKLARHPELPVIQIDDWSPMACCHKTGSFLGVELQKCAEQGLDGVLLTKAAPSLVLVPLVMRLFPRHAPYSGIRLLISKARLDLPLVSSRFGTRLH